MKAEHRHELKTNALADTLGRVLHGLKTAPSRHTLLLGGLLVGAVVVAATAYFIFRSEKEARSALWVQVDDADRKLDNAANTQEVEAALDDIKKAAGSSSSAVPARVLRFERARTLFRLGTERLASDHEKAVGYLKEARDLYADLAKESAERDKNEPILAQEALMNVARSDEGLGEVEKARDGYKELAKRYPKSMLGEAARKRGEYLDDDNNVKLVKELNEKLEKRTGSLPKLPETPEEKK